MKSDHSVNLRGKKYNAKYEDTWEGIEKGRKGDLLKEMVESALQNSFFITTSFAANHHTITTQ